MLNSITSGVATGELAVLLAAMIASRSEIPSPPSEPIRAAMEVGDSHRRQHAAVFQRFGRQAPMGAQLFPPRATLPFGKAVAKYRIPAQHLTSPLFEAIDSMV